MAYSLRSLDELPTEMPAMGTMATGHIPTEALEGVARAMGQTGRSIAESFETGSKVLAGYLEQQQQIENKTRASDATRTGRIGLSGLSADLLSKQGADALEAWKTYPQRQQQIIDSTIETGTNPYQKLLIREQMNNHADALMDIGARHTAQQEKQYQKTTAAANENEHGNTALNMAMQGNLAEAYRNLDLAQDEAKNHIHLDLGIPPGKELDELGKERLGPHVANVVEAIYRKPADQGGGVGPAQEFFDSVRGKIDEKATAVIDRFLKSAHQDAEAERDMEELRGTVAARTRDMGAGIGGATAAIHREFREKFGHPPPPATAAPTAPAPGATTRVPGGLSMSIHGVATDAADALKSRGVDLGARITSGYRTPEHNLAVGGARGSQHLRGNAIDVRLDGMSETQRNAVIDHFLSDPRVGGFGYYPHSNSIHVDARAGTRTAWGTDYHSTSVGAGWPPAITERVREWQARGAEARGPAGILAEARRQIAAGKSREFIAERLRTRYGLELRD